MWRLQNSTLSCSGSVRDLPRKLGFPLMRLAILDDDSDQLQFACDVLAPAGYSCYSFRAGKELINSLRKETYDLVILDWNLGDVPGVDVLRWIRGNCSPNLPVLFLTMRSTSQDVVYALNSGADDYLIKPVNRDIFLARISTLLRRSRMREATVARLEYKEFVFDLKEEKVYRCGEHIPLSQKEFQVAVLLFRNIARPLSRTQIFQTVWKHSGHGMITRTVDTHVSVVRTKLRLRPENGYVLVPVYGYGYRLEHLGEEPA